MILYVTFMKIVLVTITYFLNHHRSMGNKNSVFNDFGPNIHLQYLPPPLHFDIQHFDAARNHVHYLPGRVNLHAIHFHYDVIRLQSSAVQVCIFNEYTAD